MCWSTPGGSDSSFQQKCSRPSELAIYKVGTSPVKSRLIGLKLHLFRAEITPGQPIYNAFNIGGPMSLHL